VAVDADINPDEGNVVGDSRERFRVRDLEGPLEQRQLFVGRVGAYENTRNPRDPMSPEFNMATDDELARAEAYVNAHPEVDYPKTTFARAS